jgi:hypothetical protein
MKLDTPKDFSHIVSLIKDAQTCAVKAVNTELINLYWNVGGYISNQLANAAWGDKTVDELADFIQREHPEIKGFNRRGLYRMKQFYETYSSMSFVTSAMSQIQSSENKHHEIVSSAMSQFQVDDIRGSILTKVSNFYLEALDRDVRKPNENPSIGVLLCKDKDSEVVEYALSRYLSPTMVSEYRTQLPDKNLLQRKLHELFDK